MTSGFSLHSLDPYWASLAPAVHAVGVYLEEEHWLAETVLVLVEGRTSQLTKPDLRSCSQWPSVHSPDSLTIMRAPATVKASGTPH
jgi:hypothetical protein